MSRLYLAVLLLALSAAVFAEDANPLADPGFWDEVAQLSAREEIDDEAGAVVWLDERATKVTRDASGYNRLIRRHVQVLILDCDKAEAMANVSIPFGPGRSVMELEARTFLKNGEVVEVSARDIHEITEFPQYVLYSKNKAKVFAFPAVCDSCLLDYEFTTFSGLYPDDLFLLQREQVPVRTARYILTIPSFLYESGWFAVKTNADLPDPVLVRSTQAEGPVVMRTWELGPLPAARPEPRMPAKLDVYEYIWVGPDLGAGEGSFAGERISWWDDAGRYLWEAMEGAARGGGSLGAYAASLVSGLSNDLDRASEIYRFVQRSIRYVAIDLEASGYVPNEARETLRVRYGDCKDMVCLMLTMLREAGVTAHPAYVATRSMGQVNRNLVTTSQFNHVIVALPVGGQLVWFDPTDDKCPPGLLPSDLEGVQALVVFPDSATFVTTPETTAEDNVVDRTLEIELCGPDRACMSLREERLGHPAVWLRWELATRDLEMRHRFLEEVVSSAFPGARIVDFRVEGLDASTGPVELDISFELDGFVDERDGYSAVPVWSSALPVSPFSASDRRYPLAFAYPYTIRERMLVDLGSSAVLLRAPPDIDLDVGPGSLSSSVFSTGPGRLVRDVRFQLRKTFLPRSDYELTKRLFDGAERAREATVDVAMEP
jgi:hypothetical protein